MLLKKLFTIFLKEFKYKVSILQTLLNNMLTKFLHYSTFKDCVQLKIMPSGKIMVVALLLAVILVPIASCDLIISDEDYKLLPPIFRIDPFEECLAANKTHCKIKIKLEPLDKENPSKLWKVIAATKTSKRHYKHDDLYYAICVNDYSEGFLDKSTTEVKSNLSLYFTNAYEKQGIRARVTRLINCQRNDDHPPYQKELYDYLFIFAVGGYLIIACLVTLYDMSGNRAKINKFLVLFSIKHNYNKMMTNYRKACTEKLECIQGFRFYTTVFIIFCHTFCSYIVGYVENTKYFEEIHLNFFRQTIVYSFLFLVQTFFLISGWLLSYKSFNIFTQDKTVPASKFLSLTFISRYLRILPPLAYVVAMLRAGFLFSYFAGPVKDIYATGEQLRCTRNWWATLLFINNHYENNAMCNSLSWYLSADTQLYIISLIILITIYKKKKIALIFTSALTIGIIIPAIINYVYNLDIVYRITPEHSKNLTFLRTGGFATLYSSTVTNAASYMLGLIFGYIHYKSNGAAFYKLRPVRFVWYILFLGLPIMTIVASTYEYSGFYSALLAGLLKPLYALGIAVGILGMSQNIGGRVKALFEWKPLIFLGQITYSTYVIQAPIVFYRSFMVKRPLYVSDFVLLKSGVQDVILSFLAGFLLHLLLEVPASQLQAMLVPKLRYNVKIKQ